MTETRPCRYEPCPKEFVPTHPRQEFCGPTCRANQHYVDHPEKGRALRGGALRSVAAAPAAPDQGRLREPTDAERLAIALVARGERGIHSYEIRKLSISGNPSQRIIDLEDQGYDIEHRREFRGRKPGVRYVLLSEPGEMSAKAA